MRVHVTPSRIAGYLFLMRLTRIEQDLVVILALCEAAAVSRRQSYRRRRIRERQYVSVCSLAVFHRPPPLLYPPIGLAGSLFVIEATVRYRQGMVRRRLRSLIR